VKLPFDGNKLYASEILSILLQDSPDNRQMLGDLEGIDVILQQLAVGILDHSHYFYLFFIYLFIYLFIYFFFFPRGLLVFLN